MNRRLFVQQERKIRNWRIVAVLLLVALYAWLGKMDQASVEQPVTTKQIFVLRMAGGAA